MSTTTIRIEGAMKDRAADQRWAKILTTGETVPWDDARAYIEARSNGQQADQALARKLARSARA